MRRLALAAPAAAVLFALAALAGVARPDGARSAEPPQRTLTVTGAGSVQSVPDTAAFGFGVLTQAKTAAAALTANAAAAAKVVDALKQAGVAAADLQTQQVSLMPRFDDNGREILGYDAQNTVSATIRSLGRAGAVVDAAVAAGADQVSGPSLTVARQAALYRQALAAAYADAKAKADALAAKVGATLGQAVQVTENGSAPQPVALARPAAADQSVEPGTQEIGAQLTVTFALA